MQIKELYKNASILGIDNKRVDELIEKFAGESRKNIFLLGSVNSSNSRKIINALGKIASSYPPEYILEKANFYSLDFFVNRNVLIPRNDTEVMIDEVLEEAKKYNKITLIDVGAGSSNIIIALFLNSPYFLNGYAIDVSKKALEVSKINICRYSLEDKITLIKGNLLSSFVKKNDYTLSKHIIITANLPYISKKDIESIDKSTLNYEPSIALFGGEETGFELYEKLITQTIRLKEIYMPSSISLFIEIGYDQYDLSKEIFDRLGLKAKYYRDNSGIMRCVKVMF